MPLSAEVPCKTLLELPRDTKAASADVQQKALNVVMQEFLTKEDDYKLIYNTVFNFVTEVESVFALRKTCKEMSSHNASKWRRHIMRYAAPIRKDIRQIRLQHLERERFRKFRSPWSADRPPGSQTQTPSFARHKG